MSTQAPLVLVGAGGFARETSETVRMLGETWELLGFVDDDPALQGRTVDEVPVLGPVSNVVAFPDAHIVVCTGSPSNYFSRKAIVRRLNLHGSRYATIVHPAANLAPSTVIGLGTVVLAGVVATTSVTIGNHVAMMPSIVLTHDDVIEDYSTLGAGVCCAGGVTVSEGAYVGSGAMIREGRTIGPWSLVGMGSVVTKDVPAFEVWAGVPARKIRDVSAPPGFAPTDR